ncbi:hypothetical protein CL616_01575 [archaeon]|nr:hypothetical protein [archaeon]
MRSIKYDPELLRVMSIKERIADILIIGGATFILVWAILKSIGVINTVWVEMLPLFAVAGTIFVGIFKLGALKKSIMSRFNALDKRIDGVEKRLEKVEDRLTRMDERLIKLEHEHHLFITGKLNISLS